MKRILLLSLLCVMCVGAGAQKATKVKKARSFKAKIHYTTASDTMKHYIVVCDSINIGRVSYQATVVYDTGSNVSVKIMDTCGMKKHQSIPAIKLNQIEVRIVERDSKADSALMHTTYKRAKSGKDAGKKETHIMPMLIHADDFINPGSTTDRTLPEEKQAIPWYERLDCVKLNKNQIKSLDPSYFVTQTKSSYPLVSMQNVGDETFVTFALYIHWDHNWFALNKAQAMVDPASGDRYFPRRVLNDIPMDKVLRVEGYKGRNITYTIVYPRLKESVEQVAFIDTKPIQTELPLNRAAKQTAVVTNVKELLSASERRGEDLY